jgi:hypothetical protein
MVALSGGHLTMTQEQPGSSTPSQSGKSSPRNNRRGLFAALDQRDYGGMPDRPQKITFAKMRESGVRGILVY